MNLPLKDNTKRFTSRVPYYHQSRPRYPHSVIDLLIREIKLTPEWKVADIGAGTGISSELFLDYGCTVHAIEPNADMRQVAVEHYGHLPNFTAVEGTAEATTLADHSIDLIISGQAFHWFNREQTRTEFKRILKPNGYVVLMWNTAGDGVSDFQTEYNALVETYDAEKGVTPKARQDMGATHIQDFFGATPCIKHELMNEQSFDFDRLQGRLLSSSYIPLPGHSDYEPMIARLREIFDQHQAQGRVKMLYTTEVFWGNLG